MILSIEFTTANLYITEQKVTSRGIRVNKVIRGKMPESSYQNGVILNTNAVAGAITDLLKENNIHTRKTVVCAEENDVIQKELCVPAGNAKQVYGMVENELNKADILKNEYLFDYIHSVDSEEGDGKTLNVKAYLMPKALVQNYYQTVKRAGLTPVGFKPLGDVMEKLARLLGLDRNEEVAILADVEKSSIGLYMTGAGAKSVYRSIHMGEEDAIEENVFIVSALSNIQKTLEPEEKILENLIETVSKLVQFQFQSSRGSKIGQILLYGEMAQNEKFLERVESATGIRTLRCPLPEDKIRVVRGDENLWNYNTVGADCGGLLGEKKELSFFKRLEEQKSGHITQRDKIPAVVGLLVVAAVSVGYAAVSLGNMGLEREIGEDAARIRQIEESEKYRVNQAMLDETEALNQYNTICQQYVGVLEGTKRLETEEFRRVDAIKPGDIHIVAYSYEDGAAIFRCTATDQDGPAGFAKAVTDAGYFDQVKYTGFTADTDMENTGYYSFQLECVLKQQGE